jgi:hypothetical protein
MSTFENVKTAFTFQKMPITATIHGIPSIEGIIISAHTQRDLYAEIRNALTAYDVSQSDADKITITHSLIDVENLIGVRPHSRFAFIPETETVTPTTPAETDEPTETAAEYNARIAAALPLAKDIAQLHPIVTLAIKPTRADRRAAAKLAELAGLDGNEPVTDADIIAATANL